LLTASDSADERQMAANCIRLCVDKASTGKNADEDEKVREEVRNFRSAFDPILMSIVFRIVQTKDATSTK